MEMPKTFTVNVDAKKAIKKIKRIKKKIKRLKKSLKKLAETPINIKVE